MRNAATFLLDLKRARSFSNPNFLSILCHQIPNASEPVAPLLPQLRSIVLRSTGRALFTPRRPCAARNYLKDNGLGDWSDEISHMILEHHKIRPVVNGLSPLVELFRRGDLVDFSLGFVRSGLSSDSVKQVKTAFPNAGFHRTLAALAGSWFLRHPRNPAPMMKW